MSNINENKFKNAATIVSQYAAQSYTSILTSLSALNNDNTFVLRYPAPIAIPDDINTIVTSSTFIYNGVECVIRNKLESNILQIVSSAGDVISPNIGNYDATTGKVTLTYFTPSSIAGGRDYIQLSVVPANQSSIAPVRNNILVYDPDVSAANAIITAAND